MRTPVTRSPVVSNPSTAASPMNRTPGDPARAPIASTARTAAAEALVLGGVGAEQPVALDDRPSLEGVVGIDHRAVPPEGERRVVAAAELLQPRLGVRDLHRSDVDQRRALVRGELAELPDGHVGGVGQELRRGGAADQSRSVARGSARAEERASVQDGDVVLAERRQLVGEPHAHDARPDDHDAPADGFHLPADATGATEQAGPEEGPARSPNCLTGFPPSRGFVRPTKPEPRGW